jgi:hypothetical protein
MAEVAFLSDPFGEVEGDGAIRAGFEASLASGACLSVQYDDAVRALGDCLHRTSLRAGRIVAVPAHADSKSELELSGYPLRTVFPHRDELDSVGSLVLLLAGHLAGLAAPAEIFPYRQSIRRHGFAFRSG